MKWPSNRNVIAGFAGGAQACQGLRARVRCHLPRLALFLLLVAAGGGLFEGHVRGSSPRQAEPQHRVYVPAVRQPLRVFLPLSAGGASDYLPPLWIPLDTGATNRGGSPAESYPIGQPLTAGFVTRAGQKLQLDGAPYTFVGTNVSYLAGPYFPEDRVESIVSDLAGAGVEVIRVWVDARCDLERVERMLDLGAVYGIRFIITLQDFYGQQTGRWFREECEYIDVPHIRRIVPRFADRPELLMWELMNEPTCPSGDAGPSCWEALNAWAQRTSSEVKRFDPSHLVSVGTARAGFDSASVDAFRHMHSLDTVDAISLHGEVGKLLRGEFEQELAVAAELDKPVYLGEVTMRGHNEACRPLPDNALERRAQEIAADVPACFESGVDGYLLWQYAYGAVGSGSDAVHYCGVYDYFSDDPVWAAIRALP